MKRLVINQLNISIETLLQREKCYFGYIMPDLTKEQRKCIELGLFSRVQDSLEWIMHHYEARVKVSA